MTAGRFLPGGVACAGRPDLDGRAAQILGPAAAAVAATVAVGGATLLVRRLAGGFTVTPGPAPAWAVAIVGSGLVATIDLAARLGCDRRPSWIARGGLAAAALALLPIGDGLARPARLAGAAAVTAALVVAVAPLAAGISTLPAPRPLRDGGRAAPPSEPSAPPPVVASASPPAGLRQRLERFETAGGGDCLRGLVVLAVPAGSRTGHAHVGFCPPFAGTPVVEAGTDCDFVEAEIAAAEILPWGVRIECRLAVPAEEPLEIPVDVAARHPA